MFWIASAAPITYVGAQPVFADIDPATWCISRVDRAPHHRKLGGDPVGLYGLPADMPAIRKITEKFKIHLIEDAAQSFGGKFQERCRGVLRTSLPSASMVRNTDDWRRRRVCHG